MFLIIMFSPSIPPPPPGLECDLAPPGTFGFDNDSFVKKQPSPMNSWSLPPPSNNYWAPPLPPGKRYSCEREMKKLIKSQISFCIF